MTINHITKLLSQLEWGGIAFVGIALAMAFSAWGVAYAMSQANQKAVEAMARQPEVADKISNHIQLFNLLQEGIALGSLALLFSIGNNVAKKYTSNEKLDENWMHFVTEGTTGEKNEDE